jgi:sodium/bile acid cotransporter 7
VLKQLFLPTGLLLAMLTALLLPAGGVFLTVHHGTRVLIFIIFLVSGYQTGSKGLALDRSLAQVFVVSAVISLLLAPLLGVLVTRAVHFAPSIALGIILITAMPPTISSGIVITEVSRGNPVLALFITISLNLLAIFTMPFILDLCLKTAGPMDIDQAALLLKMLLFVLLPFAVGKAVHSAGAKSRISPGWSYVNSSCVILLVYSSLSVSRGSFADQSPAEYGVILAAVALLHIVLLAVNAQAGRMLGLNTADCKALVFVNSQKTLAVALAVLANIRFDTGNAIIVCLMFHFFQLFADSFLAGWWQKRGNGLRESRAEE